MIMAGGPKKQKSAAQGFRDAIATTARAIKDCSEVHLAVADREYISDFPVAHDVPIGDGLPALPGFWCHNFACYGQRRWLLPANIAICNSAQCASNERSYPEKPELLQCPSSDE